MCLDGQHSKADRADVQFSNADLWWYLQNWLSIQMHLEGGLEAVVG